MEKIGIVTKFGSHFERLTSEYKGPHNLVHISSTGAARAAKNDLKGYVLFSFLPTEATDVIRILRHAGVPETHLNVDSESVAE